MNRKSSFSDIKDLIEKHNVEFIDIKAVDLWGKWRHLTIPISKFDENLLKQGIGFGGSCYGYGSLESSDLLILPDLSTVKIETTRGKSILSIIGDIFESDDEGSISPYPHYPRETTKRVMKYLRNTGVADRALFSPEYEFYVFDSIKFGYEMSKAVLEVHSREKNNISSEFTFGSGYKLDREEGYHASPPADSTMEIRNEVVSYLEKQGISVKYHHHEMGGAGESEIEVEFSNILEAADHTLFIKYIVKNFANELGRTATFMPKPINNYPGNGMHVHQYLLKDGKNIFNGNQYGGLSKTALSYIGGIFSHGKSLTALTNPSTNSYKRLVPNQAAPVHFVFSESNRTGAIRLPGYVTNEERARVELRTVDATCNPYLAFAAIMMAGIDGIKKEIDPTEKGFGPFERNFYDLGESEKSQIDSAPPSLSSAVKSLENDHDYLLKGNVFTEYQIESWIKKKRKEVSQLKQHPNPYEHKMYYDC